ncbi:hypothetical protein [Deinococcus marmoris]|uniref:Uncharacterized protein n=1 Tax=Deinococcus marmoris TaxID=249408 RepID=A0A1U7NRQ5_9DEIO|nr:hypothetical protein [Deinococcus marmoris]OLV15598.1 hypothetical protein BOO71_0014395 [Deinococcus marmoris]
MTLLMLALLPAAVALCLLVALAVSVLIRSIRGERWAVPFEGSVVPRISPNLQVNAWMGDAPVGGIVRKSVA